ncbi:sulfotransferase family cytosolic 1B member 1-like [Stegodyphus dumicola]|uniref:sulfotransferase family cytosolic 1B member 1-like n=1 Tax=Stegodyphus dumicola TaxID=202533 RepID=UPI0015AB1ACF|nr:sulfotransferase family cytosolic 1B member 1-like [Stegodyphus dumicola]
MPQSEEETKKEQNVKAQMSEEEMKKESCVLLLFVRGRPFPGSRWFYKEIIEEALNFKPRDTDILISTFPKCGTNWMKYIVHTIITRGQKPLESSHQLTYEAVPFVDISGIAAVEALPDPRPIHYHLPYDLIPKNPKAKYIYIFRNPKDTVVSFYHFTMQTDELNVSFDEYFDTFMKGLVAYGDYFDHVLSWYEHRNDPNVLFLSYEQLHANTKEQVLRIAKFLGEHYYEELVKDKELAELVLKLISFESMKKTLMKEAPGKHEYELKSEAIDSPFQTPGPRYEVKYLRYFRKGIVGDWKNHLSPEQNRRMDQRIQEKFGGTEIIEMFNAKKTWL